MKTLVAYEEKLGSVAGALQAAVAALFTLPVLCFGKALRKAHRVADPEQEIAFADIRSILITRVDGLGDLVLFSSVVKEIRHLWPTAHITLVVDQRFASFVEQCPHVDEVLGFNQRGSKFARVIKGPIRAYKLAKSKLWRRQFDLAISPRWDVDSRHAAVLNYISLARYRFGFPETVSDRKRHINYGLNKLFTNLIPTKHGVRHEFERNGEVLAGLGGVTTRMHGPELWLSDADRAYARQALAKHSVPTHQLLVCLGIGATEAKRRWPIERFTAVAEWLVAKYDAKLLVIGDSVDACNAEQMRSILGNSMINQAGVCTVRQSAALLSFCNVFVGNDSGPMHLAAAQDIPVVELSCHPESAPGGHINSPLRYAPLGSWVRVLQPPALSANCQSGCNHASAHCILNIYFEDVQNIVEEVINEQSFSRRNVATAGD